MDKSRLRKMYERIINFLREREEASTKEIWEALRSEDESIPEYSYFTRLIKLMAGDPSLIYTMVDGEPAENKFLEVTILESRKKGKELVWYIKTVKFYSTPKRIDEECDFLSRLELLEGTYSPSLVRISLNEDIEARIIAFITDILCQGDFNKMLLKPKPSEVLEMWVSGGDISFLPVLFTEAVTEILITYTGVSRIEVSPDNPRECWRKIAEILRNREIDEGLFVPVDDIRDSEDRVICATDASKITSDSLFISRLFRIYLAFGIARCLENGGKRAGYTYTAEPPLDSERFEPGMSRIWHETDHEVDEYERRMERAILNRIHYILDYRILTETGVWYPADREILPDVILHDGRLVPELFRPHDLITEKEESNPTKSEYAKLNRRVVTLFNQLFVGGENNIVGVVKSERLPFLAIILTLYFILHIKKSHTDRESVKKFLNEYCTYIIRNKNNPLFYLRIIAIYGIILSNVLGKPVRTCCILRPLHAYTGYPPEKISDIPNNPNLSTETTKFFKKQYIPLLERGLIANWYIFPKIGNSDILPEIIRQGLCFPRLEIFVHRSDSQNNGDHTVKEKVSILSSIMCSRSLAWDLDRRHSAESKLMLPYDLISVDFAALQGNKDLEKRIVSKFFEIRKLAKEMGLIA